MQRSGFKQKPRETPVKRLRRVAKRKKNGVLTQGEKTRLLKKKLWAIFSQYIRKRNADPMSGYVATVDGEYVHWQYCDCGHLRHYSERNSLLGGNELWYYENNFAPQSNQGNRLNKDDSSQKYMLWAIKTYGVEEVDKMFQMKQTYRLWTYQELEEKYHHYKALFEAL
jgi:hypothetical protein